MKTFDVVVVGARVAGAATALHLARAGHDVLIVDRAGPPADTTSTHALMRSGVLQLQRAGLLERIIEAGTPAVETVNLTFGAEQVEFAVSDAYGVRAYYAPRRTVLDPILLEAAEAAGATFWDEFSVQGITRDARNRVSGVSGHRYDRELSVAARWVVGADGTQSRIARAVGSHVLRSAPPNNSIAFGYFAGLKRHTYDFRFVSRRNVGLIPTNDDLSLVFVGGPKSEAPLDGDLYLKTTLAQVAPDLADGVAGAERVGRLYRSSGIPNILRQPSGDGWALVGDAGFTEDPISAHESPMRSVMPTSAPKQLIALYATRQKRPKLSTHTRWFAIALLMHSSTPS